MIFGPYCQKISVKGKAVEWIPIPIIEIEQHRRKNPRNPPRIRGIRDTFTPCTMYLLKD